MIAREDIPSLPYLQRNPPVAEDIFPTLSCSRLYPQCLWLERMYSSLMFRKNTAPSPRLLASDRLLTLYYGPDPYFAHRPGCGCPNAGVAKYGTRTPPNVGNDHDDCSVVTHAFGYYLIRYTHKRVAEHDVILASWGSDCAVLYAGRTDRVMAELKIQGSSNRVRQEGGTGDLDPQEQAYF